MEPITIAIGVVTAIFGAGVTYELTTREKNLKTQGQNDITETDCPKLCVQLRTRWNELCKALADEAYLRDRWQQAALAAAGAAAAAVALQVAATAALASVFGVFVALVLGAAVLVATAIAVAAAGFASSALTGFNGASTVANGARGDFSSAEAQMSNACGEARTTACRGQLPACP